MRYFLVWVGVFLLVGCGEQQAYEPRQLTKLTEEQLFERISSGLDPYTADITYKNQRGDILTNNNVIKMMMAAPNEYAIDFFVNEEQMIQEGVIREFGAADSLLQQRVNQFFSKNEM
ncbi:MAG: hypothetical protein AB8G22_16030 [Saprospiraceae bacterium]